MLAGSLLLLGIVACEDAAPTLPLGEGEVAAIYAKNGNPNGALAEVTPQIGEIEIGETLQLVAVDAEGNEIRVNWSTSGTDVAEVSREGLVTGVAAGNATITAKSRKERASAEITVTAPGSAPSDPGDTSTPVVETVSISPEGPTVEKGKTVQLTATALDAKGQKLTGRKIEWRSSSSGVATVSSSGLVSGVSAGSTVIQATVDGTASDTTLVTVTETTSAPVAPPSSGSGIWISQQEIMALPMSGTAWQNVKSAADSSCGTPDLENQDDPTNVCVLAKALVYARTGTAQYRSDVVSAIRSVANSGTYNGRALALGREIGAYVLAADLIGLSKVDATLDNQFRNKLRELRTTPLSSGPSSLVDCNEKRPNNWGQHCGASRAAIAIYLGDTADLARTAQIFRGWLGDRSAYAGFTYGDLSWQCDPSKPVGINPKGCTKDGHPIDGVLPEDQRRAGSFTWPAPKENYVYEALQGALALAVILHRQGYDVFNWSDRALLRAFQWTHNVANFPATGDDTWQPHVINHFYGTNFPAPVPSRSGKSVGFTDWTLGR